MACGQAASESTTQLTHDGPMTQQRQADDQGDGVVHDCVANLQQNGQCCWLPRHLWTTPSKTTTPPHLVCHELCQHDGCVLVVRLVLQQERRVLLACIHLQSTTSRVEDYSICSASSPSPPGSALCTAGQLRCICL
jgi:hypothetical protein